MNDERGNERPDRPKDQEQLGRDDRIGHEIAIGDAREHLRARQCHEHRVALDPIHGLAAQAGGGLDARDDARGPEENEAAKDHRGTVAPVDAPGEHQEADGRDRDYRHNGRDRSEQRSFKPTYRRNQDARTRRIGKFLGLGDARMKKTSRKGNAPGNPRLHTHSITPHPPELSGLLPLQGIARTRRGCKGVIDPLLPQWMLVWRDAPWSICARHPVSEPAMYLPSTSLTDPPVDSPIAAGLAWVQAAALGSTATAIAVIAVATIGLLTLSGRIELRRSVTAIIGCFLLFGAAGIASGLTQAKSETQGTLVENARSLPTEFRTEGRAAQPSAYDPYAGASVPSSR